MYTVENPISKALSSMGQAGQTYSNMQPKIPVPGKTIGGALMSGLGAAGTGAAMTSLFAPTAATATAGAAAGAATAEAGMGLGALMSSGWGIPIAASIGIGAYLLS